jgi:hypothetical protein
MKEFSQLWIACVLIAIGLANARAQAPSKESEAMEALNQMGAYLRTLKSFQVTAEVTEDHVLTEGQKVTFHKTVDILARMPDRVFARESGDRRDRHYFYDGKTFTLYARRAGYYATVNAPPTIGKLAEVAWDKYQMHFPLEDLFFWGSDRLDSSVITGAADIGPASVGGITCQHFVFRQPGLDWQIWIQKGDHPLPRKLVLTTLTDEARPQHTSVLTWNLAPSYNEATFTFNPPEDARKIVFAAVTAASK